MNGLKKIRKMNIKAIMDDKWPNSLKRNRWRSYRGWWKVGTKNREKNKKEISITRLSISFSFRLFFRIHLMLSLKDGLCGCSSFYNNHLYVQLILFSSSHSSYENWMCHSTLTVCEENVRVLLRFLYLAHFDALPLILWFFSYMLIHGMVAELFQLRIDLAFNCHSFNQLLE